MERQTKESIYRNERGIKRIMGQRFQVIENTNGQIKVYHFQWLWGDYAIRRIGTAIKNFLIHNKDGYRSFEDFLKMSCYGKPNDMNPFFRYFDNTENWSDNKEICSYYKGKNKVYTKKKDFRKFLQELNNNDGYFYMEFSDKFLNGQSGFKGYCFIANGYGKNKKEYKPITAEQYIKNYSRQEGFTKKQLKEFKAGRKVFLKLNLIEFPKFIEVI